MTIIRVFIILVLLSGISGCEKPRRMHDDTRVLMGTYVQVVSDDKRASGLVFGEIQRLESLLSKYRPQSELSMLNASGKMSVGPDLMHLLIKSKEFWFATDGAFDITVAPLMDIWGFTDKEFRLPSEAEIASALNLVGMNKIIFHPSDSVVEFNVQGMKIDLGAVAKGYALDCAVKVLKQAGVGSCLINAGGQVHCLGTNAGKPWKVAIKNPRGADVSGFMELSDRAVATSGDYEQFFFIGAKRYSHIMNPRTGYPSESGIISATVIAPDGLTADFLATSIVVLGKEKGMNLLKRFPGVEVKIIEQ